jgi:hypothetical protein
VFLQSLVPWLQTTLLQALLGALQTRPAAALLTTPTVHLYTALSGQLGPAVDVSQFTEATFSGYAAVALSGFTGPVNVPSNQGQGIFGSSEFTANSSITSPGQIALGYWVDDGTSTIYLCESFETPVLFVNPGDFLNLATFFAIPWTTRIS